MQPSRPSSLSPHLLNRRGAQNAADRPLRSVRPAPVPPRATVAAPTPHGLTSALLPRRRRFAGALPLRRRRLTVALRRRRLAVTLLPRRRRLVAPPLRRRRLAFARLLLRRRHLPSRSRCCSGA